MAQQHDHTHHHHSEQKKTSATEHACCAHEPKTPPTPAPKAGGKTIYVCPMHPQVRKEGPGTCPICGMALEPEVASGEDAPNQELIDMRRRFWISLALTAPVFVIEMGGHLFNLHMSGKVSNWLQFALATPVVLWGGWPFFHRAWLSLVTRNLNMFTLIALGTGAAWLYSIVAILVPTAFPASLQTADGFIPVYFEAAAVIVVLVLLGQVLELRAREKTGSAIKALLNLAPKIARHIKEDGSEEDIPLEQVQVGDRSTGFTPKTAGRRARAIFSTFAISKRASSISASARTRPIPALKCVSPLSWS